AETSCNGSSRNPARRARPALMGGGLAAQKCQTRQLRRVTGFDAQILSSPNHTVKPSPRAARRPRQTARALRAEEQPGQVRAWPRTRFRSPDARRLARSARWWVAGSGRDLSAGPVVKILQPSARVTG